MEHFSAKSNISGQGVGSFRQHFNAEKKQLSWVRGLVSMVRLGLHLVIDENTGSLWPLCKY